MANDETSRGSMCCVAFLDKHKLHRAEIRKKSESINSDLLNAHQLALSAVISYQNRIQGMQYEAKYKQLEARSFLVAQFIQGIELASTAISEGLYPQAANLLKQKIETLAAIDEYEAGKRKEGKTPNIKNLIGNFGYTYGQFNEIAHPSNRMIVEKLSSFSDGDHYGPSTVPQFDPDLFQRLIGLHATLIFMLFGRMQRIFLELFGVDWDLHEVRQAKKAHQILIEQNIINSPPTIGNG